MNFNDYFEGDFDYSLDKVNYKSISDTQAGNLLDFVCEDTIKGHWLSDTVIEFTYSRKVGFSPDFLFSILVSYKFRLKAKPGISKETLSGFDLDSEILKDENSKIFNKIISYTSLLIGQLTFSSGFTPIVTPPYFIEEAK